MRPPIGPADLRHSRLNADRELRELMRPQPGPADLRYSHFQAGKELRDIMKSKAQSTKTLESVEAATDELVNDLEAATDKMADELDSNIKKRDDIIRRLRASLDEKETTKNDDSNVTTDTGDYNTNEEGEVEPSEDELTNVVQYSDSDLDTYDCAKSYNDFYGLKVRNPDEPLSPPSPIEVLYQAQISRSVTRFLAHQASSQTRHQQRDISVKAD